MFKPWNGWASPNSSRHLMCHGISCFSKGQFLRTPPWSEQRKETLLFHAKKPTAAWFCVLRSNRTPTAPRHRGPGVSCRARQAGRECAKNCEVQTREGLDKSKLFTTKAVLATGGQTGRVSCAGTQPDPHLSLWTPRWSEQREETVGWNWTLVRVTNGRRGDCVARGRVGEPCGQLSNGAACWGSGAREGQMQEPGHFAGLWPGKNIFRSSQTQQSPHRRWAWECQAVTERVTSTTMVPVAGIARTCTAELYRVSLDSDVNLSHSAKETRKRSLTSSTLREEKTKETNRIKDSRIWISLSQLARRVEMRAQRQAGPRRWQQAAADAHMQLMGWPTRRR